MLLPGEPLDGVSAGLKPLQAGKGQTGMTRCRAGQLSSGLRGAASRGARLSCMQGHQPLQAKPEAQQAVCAEEATPAPRALRWGRSVRAAEGAGQALNSRQGRSLVVPKLVCVVFIALGHCAREERGGRAAHAAAAAERPGRALCVDQRFGLACRGGARARAELNVAQQHSRVRGKRSK